MKTRLLVGMAVGALAMVFAAAPAIAAKGEGRALTFPRLRIAEFGVPIPGDYSLDFVLSNGRAEVAVSAGEAASIYLVPAKVSGNTFEARFGRLGKVDVEFRPSGRTKRTEPFPGCRGGASVTEFGEFVGTIGFHGEHGYIHASTKHAQGTLYASTREVCKGGGDEAPPSEAGEGTALTISCHGLTLSAVTERSTRRSAIFPDERSPTTVFASHFERRGRLRKVSVAVAHLRESAFVFDDALTTATISPPLPFRGSGTFTRGPSGVVAWSGSLRVDFPGATTALSGNGVSAALFHFKQTSDGHSGDGRGHGVLFPFKGKKSNRSS